MLSCSLLKIAISNNNCYLLKIAMCNNISHLLKIAMCNHDCYLLKIALRTPVNQQAMCTHAFFYPCTHPKFQGWSIPIMASNFIQLWSKQLQTDLPKFNAQTMHSVALFYMHLKPKLRYNYDNHISILVLKLE